MQLNLLPTIQQAIANLLTNALKYTPEGTTVTIDIPAASDN